MKFMNFLRKIFIFCSCIQFSNPIYSQTSEPNQPNAIIVDHRSQDISHALNPELKFGPCNTSYFNLISHELDALNVHFGHEKTISLTRNEQARSLAPHVFLLIATKAKAIAQKMGVDMNMVEICIQPVAKDVKTAFNAHAQTTFQLTATKEVLTETIVEKTFNSNNKLINTKIVDTKTTEKISHDIDTAHKLAINAETLKLFVWHEGCSGYEQSQKLLDGVIAHELAHIFHNHIECSIECECQADATGAKSLQINPYNTVIDAIDLLYFAGNLFSGLKGQQSLLGLDNTQLFVTVNTITSSLAQQVKNFGSLSQCSSHTQFASKVHQAIGKGLQRIANHKAFGDKNIMTSLMYEELKDCCQTPLNCHDGIDEVDCKIADNKLALYSPLTHPDPYTRRSRLALALR